MGDSGQARKRGAGMVKRKQTGKDTQNMGVEMKKLLFAFAILFTPYALLQIIRRVAYWNLRLEIPRGEK